MPDFFMRTRKKLGGGGELYLYPNFLCVLKEYYWGGGGGLMPDFFMRNRKKLGGGLYP